MSIKAEQIALGKLLSGDRRFIVPNYQRPYVWGPDEAELLVDDLVRAWETQDHDCFLGSVVVVIAENTVDVDVIDGQQRLTTFGLILSVLRHKLEKPEQRKMLTSMLEAPENAILNRSASPRLRLRERDAWFYDEYIVGGDIHGLLEIPSSSLENESQRNIQANVDAIMEALDPVFESGEPWSFVQYLYRKVGLVLVETDGFASAHRIFGVLNTRGVPLSSADILKARVLGEVPIADRDSYSRTWEEHLESSAPDEDRFFQHLLMLQTAQPTRRGLVDDFENRVLTPYFKDHSGAQFIDEILVPALAAYRQIGRPMPNVSGIERHLWMLSQYHSTDWVPVAMKILMSGLPSATQEELLRQLDRLFGAYTLGVIGSPRRAVAMSGVLKYLDEAGATISPNNAPAFDVPDEVRQPAVLKIRGPLAKGYMRKALLARALMQEFGYLPDLKRSTGVVSILPTESMAGIDRKVDLEPWRTRLAGLAFSPMKASELKKCAKWDDVTSRLASHESVGRSIAGGLFPEGPLTEKSLEARQQRLVEAILDYWDIRYNAEGWDLANLPEPDLFQLVGGRKVNRTRRVLLADIVEAGILNPGDALIWRRANIGDSYRVLVTMDGKLDLGDGREVASPSAAVKELTGTTANAHKVFVRESDGMSLREMWDEFDRRARA